MQQNRRTADLIDLSSPALVWAHPLDLPRADSDTIAPDAAQPQGTKGSSSLLDDTADTLFSPKDQPSAMEAIESLGYGSPLIQLATDATDALASACQQDSVADQQTDSSPLHLSGAAAVAGCRGPSSRQAAASPSSEMAANVQYESPTTLKHQSSPCPSAFPLDSLNEDGDGSGYDTEDLLADDSPALSPLPKQPHAPPAIHEPAGVSTAGRDTTQGIETRANTAPIVGDLCTRGVPCTGGGEGLAKASCLNVQPPVPTTAPQMLSHMAGFASVKGSTSHTPPTSVETAEPEAGLEACKANDITAAWSIALTNQPASNAPHEETVDALALGAAAPVVLNKAQGEPMEVFEPHAPAPCSMPSAGTAASAAAMNPIEARGPSAAGEAEAVIRALLAKEASVAGAATSPKPLVRMEPAATCPVASTSVPDAPNTQAGNAVPEPPLPTAAPSQPAAGPSGHRAVVSPVQVDKPVLSSCSKLHDLHPQLDKVQTLVQSLEQDRSTLQSQVSQQGEELSRVKAELWRARDELARVTASRDEFSRQQGEYRAKLMKRDGEINSLARRMANLGDELDAYKEKCSSLERDLQAAQAANGVTPERSRATVRSVLEEADRARAMAKEKETALAKLRDTLEREIANNEEMQEFYEAERSTLLASNEKLAKEAADDKARYQRVAESYEKARTMYNEAAAKCNIAQEELYRTQAELYKAKEKAVEIEAEDKVLKSQLAGAQEAQAAALAQVARLERQLNDTRAAGSRMFKQVRGILHALERHSHALQKAGDLPLLVKQLQEWVSKSTDVWMDDGDITVSLVPAAGSAK